MEDNKNDNEEKEKQETKTANPSIPETKKILEQVAKEVGYARAYMKPKHDKMIRNLALYNNQKKDEEKVSDPTMYTVFNTLLAALYDDRMEVAFKGMAMDGSDDDKADNLALVAKYDYEEMDKASLDYNWKWNTLFCGRALVMFGGWDEESNTPIPTLVNPFTFYRDPKATSVHGDRLGRGALRYGGFESLMTKSEMEDVGDYMNLEKLESSDLQSGDSAQSMETEQNANQGRSDVMGETGTGSDQYSIMNWFTYWNGKKYLICTANDNSVLIRFKEIGKKWPFIEKCYSPTPDDWDGVSLPDLLGDKQRLRAIVANLASTMVKADMFPMYAYDRLRISNEADLTFDFNKGIPVNGNPQGAIVPISKSQANWGGISYVMEFADQAAQKATATPEIQQGLVSKEQRTLGELNIVAQKVETRFSLIAKLFAISEKKFWKEWYKMLKKHFNTSVSKKLIRLSGVNSDRPLKFMKVDIICDQDPDIVIDSKILSEASRIKSGRELFAIAQIAMQDPAINKRYWLREIAKSWGWDKAKIDLLFPPTGEELLAESENRKLEKNELVVISPNDDHIMHIEKHSVLVNTNAAYSHIQAHKEALRLKKANPNLMPDPNQQVQGEQPQGQPQAQPQQNPLSNILSGMPASQA